MWYVEVIVADATYHKDEPLTYASPTELTPGRIVTVPLRRKEVLGIVASTVPKPNFAAKEIISAPELPIVPVELRQLLDWMRNYYPAPLGMTAQLFLPGSLPKKPSVPKSASTTEEKPLPVLTHDQKNALAAIISPGLHILHGQTGSGKTRVYLELAKRNFEKGKSSIILTPEIGLTSQLANIFRNTFGDRVIIMHSGLTETVRQQAWQYILEQKEPLIIVGARSALFTPLANVGLIVVDEAHETSYKQDQAPYYHTSTVAAKLATLHDSTLILGSATPLVNDYYVAKAKKRPIVRMIQLAASNVGEEGSKATIIDLKDKSQFGKSPYLSTPLLEAIQDRLQKNEQILLFLNRRGTARVIFCKNCAWQATCPHCDLPLVYHGDHHIMRCHSCSYKAPTPGSCPECKSADIVFRSIGTKAIAEEAKRLFPEARIMRFDTDNKKSERLETHYESIRSGEVDIIVGTQTLAKGLDLPNLGLVGVVIADTSLYFPDFSAQERTYQLLSQVLGRVGRGHRESSAVIQTYSPDSPLIESVITKNWDTFYNKELSERREFMFPPFCYLLKLTCKRATSQSAQKSAEQFASTLRSYDYNIRVEGPAPSFHEKSQNKFAWQLIVKSKQRDHLVSIIKRLPSGWSHDIDPMNLL